LGLIKRASEVLHEPTTLLDGSRSFSGYLSAGHCRRFQFSFRHAERNGALHDEAIEGQ